MQQYNLRPVSDLSRSPSSRSSRSPQNHNMSPPSSHSHLPPIQHSANGVQPPPRRPISPSSLPRNRHCPHRISFLLIRTLRPRCLQWSGHAAKKLSSASHRPRSDAPLPPSTARAAALPQARIHQLIFPSPGTSILCPGWQRNHSRSRRL